MIAVMTSFWWCVFALAFGALVIVGVSALFNSRRAEDGTPRELRVDPKRPDYLG